MTLGHWCLPSSRALAKQTKWASRPTPDRSSGDHAAATVPDNCMQPSQPFRSCALQQALLSSAGLD